MSSINISNFDEIYSVLKEDVFPKYLHKLADDSNAIYDELLKLGSSPEEAFRSSLQGVCHSAFTDAVKLNLLITSLSNSTDDIEKITGFLKNNIISNDNDFKNTLKVIKGGIDD